jgi:hypothetical protein
MASEAGYLGRCFCGSIRYHARGAATHLCFCHCNSCRRAVGATPVPWGTFDRQQFSVVSGKLVELRSSPQVVRGFCGDCGTSITYRHEKRPEEIDVTLVTLDDPALLMPEIHIWVQDKLPWIAITDGRPQFDQVRTGGVTTASS